LGAPPSLFNFQLREGQLPRDCYLALLNTSLFYWFLTIISDCRNLNKREIYAIRFDVECATRDTRTELSALASKLIKDYERNSRMLEVNYEGLGRMTIQCIYPKLSKPIIDQIDRALAEHYGFTDEELDFIVNYDIKYRMGRDGGGREE